MKRFKQILLNNKRGSALMLAIFTTTLVIFLSSEIAQLTIMEYLTSVTEVRKVQAKHAAQACMRLNLLRIKAYQQATRSLGQALPDTTMLDMIWKFPLSWPIQAPQNLTSFDASSIKKASAGSLMKDQFVSQIAPEGGRIDINDLGSPSQILQDKTRAQLLQRLQAKVLYGRDSFAERYANFNFEILLNDIADWVDSDLVSRNGGGEATHYSHLQNRYLPPNRPFKTLEELHMVKGMTDEIYEVLEPHITLYGVKGINVNQADQDVLLSLFSAFNLEVAQQVVTEILKRRNDINLGGPFRDQDDFYRFIGAFVDASQLQDQDNIVPLYFGSELNFRILCTGLAGKMDTEIEAVVFDPEALTQRLQTTLAREMQDETNPECQGLQGDGLFECQCQNVEDDTERQSCIDNKKKSGASQGQGPAAAAPLPPGPPRVIFQQVR